MTWISLSSTPSNPYGWEFPLSQSQLGGSETSWKEHIEKIVTREFDWNVPRDSKELEKEVERYRAFVRVMTWAVSTGNYFDERLHKFDAWKVEIPKVEEKKTWWSKVKEWVHGLGRR